MKTMLKKTLLISLLFSATVPSAMQANLLHDRAFTIYIASYAVAVAVVLTVIVRLELKGRAEEATDNFLRAAENNNIAKVRQALIGGIDVNKQNNLGDSALMLAAKNGCLEVVRLLLEKDIEVDKKNNLGDSALMLAAKNGQSEVVELLLKNNADTDKQNNLGCTAFSLGNDEVKETIRKFLAQKREQTSKVLKKELPKLPGELATFISKFIHNVF